MEYVPPEDLEAEMAMLVARLLPKDAIAEVLEIASGGHFYRPGMSQPPPPLSPSICGTTPPTQSPWQPSSPRSRESTRAGGALYLHALGISTRFLDLGSLTNGLQPGQLIVVAGRPAMASPPWLGVSQALHRIALEAYDSMIGLGFDEVSVNGCITKAPCGGENAGRSPLDRVKQRRVLRCAAAGPRHGQGSGCRAKHDCGVRGWLRNSYFVVPQSWLAGTWVGFPISLATRICMGTAVR